MMMWQIMSYVICGTISAFKLENQPHITKLNFINGMLNLKFLSLEGIKNLTSYIPLLDSASIETFNGYHCQPIDKSLIGLKNLRNIGLGDSYSKAEINNFLEISKADNIKIRGKALRGTVQIRDPFFIV